MATTKKKPTSTPPVVDRRRITDAELAENLTSATRSFNTALSAAVRAGLSVTATIASPQPPTNDNIEFDGGDAAEMKPVTPALVILKSIDRKHIK